MKSPLDAIFTDHARWRMSRRGVSEAIVREVLATSTDVMSLRPGWIVVQAVGRLEGREGLRLIRVVVEVDRSPAEIVTVYETSRISKYNGAP